MPYVAADWTIDRATKDIRYIGGDHDNSPSYATVIEAHRAWQALADDDVAVPASSDELDITNPDPSRRSTDNIITLINGYNIDYNASQHLYDGSIIQNGGDTIYDGIVNFGVSSVQIQVVQDGRTISDDFWNQAGAGINPSSTAGISHRFIVLVRENGVDIDGRRLLGIARTFGNIYAEFPINGTSRGNNVLALSDKSDLNNATVIATIAGYTGITNIEGLRAIDVDNDGSTENYYSEWNTNQPTRTINDFYERTKWLSKDPVTEDANTADTGTAFVVDNATITGAAQSFAVGANAMLVTKVTFQCKATGAPTGNMTASIYTITGTHGSSAIPNTLVGSVSVGLDTSKLTTTYEETTFHFTDPISLSASTNYAIVIEHANGDASNYVQVDGLATSGTHAGNRSHNTAGWTAVAADDLAFRVYTASSLNALAGIDFRGITHSFAYDTPLGGITVATNDMLVWGTALIYSGLVGTPTVGEAIWEDTAVPTWKGRVIAVDLTNLTLIMDIESGVVTNLETWTGQSSAATGTVAGTPVVVADGGVLHIMASDSSGFLLYPQVVKGIIPANNDILYYAGTNLSTANTGQTLLVNITVTKRSIETPYVGASTGSALIGSYGLGVETLDLSKNDKLTDLTGTLRVPPNNVTNTFAGLVSGEDRVLVAPWDGSTVDTNGDPAADKGQMLISTALAVDNITSVVVKTGTEVAIPSDTPATGYIRVIDDNGFERRLHYSSWTGTTFTVDTVDGNEDFLAVNAAINNQVYIAYLDELAAATTASYTAVHTSGTRNLVALDRDGGASPIKQFISSWTFQSTGQTLTAVRTTDA